MRKMKVMYVLKYFVVAVVMAAVAETTMLLLGYWLKVRIPVVITLGLLIGVVAWFASKLHKEDHSNY